MPMIPPSTYVAPPSSTISATSRAAAGEIAFASTNSPPKPCTAHATSIEACGGQIEKMMSARSATSAGVPASVSPAARALAAVCGPRPSDAHSTSCPAPVRHRPTAAPISPG